MATVDEVMSEQEIEFVHFLKVDTEGHELEVLKGARDALSASRIAIIQVEVGVDQRGLPGRCFLLLSGMTTKQPGTSRA